MRCEYVKEGNVQCEAQAVSNDIFCFVHTALPEIVERRDLGRQEGGRNGRKMTFPAAESEVCVQNAKQVIGLLERTINDVRMNRISTNNANCIGYLCNIMAKVLEQELLETRVAVLERTILISRERVKR